jgi:hypothetical protein
VPNPDLVFYNQPIDGTGDQSVLFTVPAGLPAGLSLVFQHWIADPAGPLGWSASNAVKGTTP